MLVDLGAMPQIQGAAPVDMEGMFRWGIAATAHQAAEPLTFSGAGVRKMITKLQYKKRPLPERWFKAPAWLIEAPSGAASLWVPARRIRFLGLIVRIFNEQAFRLGGVEQFRVGGDEREGRQLNRALPVIQTHGDGELHRVVAAQKVFAREGLSVEQN